MKTFTVFNENTHTSTGVTTCTVKRDLLLRHNVCKQLTLWYHSGMMFMKLPVTRITIQEWYLLILSTPKLQQFAGITIQEYLRILSTPSCLLELQCLQILSTPSCLLELPFKNNVYKYFQPPDYSCLVNIHGINHKLYVCLHVQNLDWFYNRLVSNLRLSACSYI